jgi:membrane protein
VDRRGGAGPQRRPSAQTEAERVAAEHARSCSPRSVRLRTAEDAKAHARGSGWIADRAVRDAQEELRQVEASAPPPAPVKSIIRVIRPVVSGRS